MEKRRIQLVGRSTLTVSLPTSWVKEAGVKKGDFVTILQEKDGSLRIIRDAAGLQSGADVYTINADLCQGKGLIERLIIAGYVKGYDKVKVTSSTRIANEALREIRDAEIKLMGLSVVEEEASNVTLQCSINPADFQLDTVIRRLYVLFSTMLTEAVEALMNSNMELAEEAEGRELQANRTYALILRLLNQAQKNPEISQQANIAVNNALNMGIIANALERMADWACKIAREVKRIGNSGIEIGRGIKAYIRDYGDRIKDVCEKAVKSVFSQDIVMANTAINLFEESLDQELYKMIEQLRVESVHHGFGELRQIALAMHRIGENAVTIATTAIDAAATEKTHQTRHE